MSRAEGEHPGATGLAQRLAAAAASAASARGAAPVGRCGAPAAVDAWGAVSERCPLVPVHDGGHEVETDSARRERLAKAAATHPAEALVAVGAVAAWLAETAHATTPERPLPRREVWMLIDVAEATAAEQMTALAAPAELAATGLEGVVTDG